MRSKGYPYFLGHPEEPRKGAWRHLPPLSARDERDDPKHYVVADGLRDAVNVALALGMPLLLTGEPGTGKTELAGAVACELDMGEPLKFEAKSVSVARDLFYSYDSLGRFHAVQTYRPHEPHEDFSGDTAIDPRHFIEYQALGLAILQSKPLEAIHDFVPKRYVHQGPRRSVVLIDEVDKAPRDFPNDVLTELENKRFRVPELGRDEYLQADPEYSPVLIITSNSEKALPDAFLRRCVYYDIPFPETETLVQIVEARLGDYVKHTSPLLADAVDFFRLLRDSKTGLAKRPGTAELLDWVASLGSRGFNPDQGIRTKPAMATALTTLVKRREDRLPARDALNHWLTSGT
jgi:MoxR-like ATPase